MQIFRARLVRRAPFLPSVILKVRIEDVLESAGWPQAQLAENP